MKKNPRKTYLWLWLLLAVGLAVAVAISLMHDPKFFGLSLKQGTFRDVILAEEQGADTLAADTIPTEQTELEPDTTVKQILIFGDSMTILVANRMAQYGVKNGYKVASVTWDSSTSMKWSSCDTLDNFIKRYRPDFVMVTLGSNELFSKNFDSRVANVQKIMEKIGDIPFVWISPPNWKEDVGFNAMMEKTLPRGSFFNSNDLDLPRQKDHIHPTSKGGEIWTDSIMTWIGKSRHPILAEVPDSGTSKVHNVHYYKAGK